MKIKATLLLLTIALVASAQFFPGVPPSPGGGGGTGGGPGNTYEPTEFYTNIVTNGQGQVSGRYITLLGGGGAAGSQTPWTNDVDAAQHQLTNASDVVIEGGPLGWSTNIVETNGISINFLDGTTEFIGDNPNVEGEISIFGSGNGVTIDANVPGDGQGLLICGGLNVGTVGVQQSGELDFITPSDTIASVAMSSLNDGSMIIAVGAETEQPLVLFWGEDQGAPFPPTNGLFQCGSIGTFSTNVLTAAPATSWSAQSTTLNKGYTNLLGKNVTVNINGSIGYFVLYKNAGKFGNTPAANPICTNMLSTNGWQGVLKCYQGVQIIAGIGQANVVIDF